MPQANRVSVLVDPSVRDQLEAAQRSAPRFGLKLLPFEVGKPPYDYNAAFRAMRASDPQGLLVLLSRTFYRDREQIVAPAHEARLPAVYAATGFVEAGGLLAYGANLDEVFSKAADYVDGIPEGASQPRRRSNNRPSSIWPSIQKPRKRSGSRFHNRCYSARMS